MWDRARRRVQFRVEGLEGRELLTAAGPSLAAIAPVSVPATLGTQVPLDGSGTTDPQTFTVQSSNPDVKATVAQGKFVTFNVTHTGSGNSNDPSFSGAVTVELFNDLTPLTATTIENQVLQGFDNGKQLFRIASEFPDASGYIIQGGSPTNTSNGASSGLPGTPFLDELNPQLAFTGNYQLAMANAGPDTNDSQFFITDSRDTPASSPQFLDFRYTVFGQVVSGFNLVDDMTKVSLQSDGATPINPITITSATVSDTNPSGTIHIDATQAQPNESATITVTATDTANGQTTSQQFTVGTIQNSQVEPPYVPILSYPTVVSGTPATLSYQQTVAADQSDIFQVPAVTPSPGDSVTYTVQGGVTYDASTGQGAFTSIPNATASVNQATGVVTVTPDSGFTGTINFIVGVRDNFNRVTGATTLEVPGNYDYHQFQLTVTASKTPVFLTPVAAPVSTNVAPGQSTTIHLPADIANLSDAGLSPTFALTAQPTTGTITNFNAQNGTLTYNAPAGASGTATFQYTISTSNNGNTQTSNAATVAVTIGTSTNTAPAAPAFLSEQRVEQGQGRRKTLVFQLSFSGPLKAQTAQTPADFLVTQARGARKPVRVRVAAASYTQTGDTYTVTLKLGAYAKNRALQLTTNGLVGGNGISVPAVNTTL